MAEKRLRLTKFVEGKHVENHDNDSREWSNGNKDGTVDLVADDITQLVAKELASANMKYALFHSSHEGYAVVAEEVEECNIELKNLLRYIDSLFLHVRLNDTGLQNLIICDIRKSAINLACEAIQVAAMCDKWEMSFAKERVE